MVIISCACRELSIPTGVFFKGKKISTEVILRGCSTIVYVIDAQEGDFDDCLPKLVTTILAAHKVNPAIHFEVFLHKGLQIENNY